MTIKCVSGNGNHRSAVRPQFCLGAVQSVTDLEIGMGFVVTGAANHSPLHLDGINIRFRLHIPPTERLGISRQPYAVFIQPATIYRSLIIICKGLLVLHIYKQQANLVSHTWGD